MSSEILFEHLVAHRKARLEAYRDEQGVLTIGYDHQGSDISEGDRITEYWARELLRVDIAKAEVEVRKLHVTRTQGQFDTLVSIVMEVGIEEFRRSPLLRQIRRHDRYSSLRRALRQRVAKFKGKAEWEARRYFE